MLFFHRFFFLVNILLFPFYVKCLKVNDHYFYTKFPDFIKTAKTSRQVDVADTK